MTPLWSSSQWGGFSSFPRHRGWSLDKKNPRGLAYPLGVLFCLRELLPGLPSVLPHHLWLGREDPLEARLGADLLANGDTRRGRLFCLR